VVTRWHTAAVLGSDQHLPHGMVAGTPASGCSMDECASPHRGARAGRSACRGAPTGPRAASANACSPGPAGPLGAPTLSGGAIQAVAGLVGFGSSTSVGQERTRRLVCWFANSSEVVPFADCAGASTASRTHSGRSVGGVVSSADRAAEGSTVPRLVGHRGAAPTVVFLPRDDVRCAECFRACT